MNQRVLSGLEEEGICNVTALLHTARGRRSPFRTHAAGSDGPSRYSPATCCPVSRPTPAVGMLSTVGPVRQAGNLPSLTAVRGVYPGTLAW